jgi:hypothetical protein
MKISRKTGEWTGKLVKTTTAAPTKTATWGKRFAHDINAGYRSVVPKVETKETTEK